MAKKISTTSANISKNLQQFFGFKNFKGQQEAIIRSILEGHNTFVIMPTGGGKSLCYQLPALMSEGTAIIVSPLIALMKNQVDALRGFGAEDGIAHFMNSLLTKAELIKVKEDITSGLTKLLYVAPETLTKEENVAFFKEIPISFYAVDEAHCISEWGHDFRPEYRKLFPIIQKIQARPILALTATATPKVQQDIQRNLNMMEAVLFKDSFNRPNLYYEIRPKKEVAREIIKFIKQRPGASGIIYCLSRKKVEEIAETLLVNGIKAAPYHAGLESGIRSAHQDAFLMEDVEVIVATIAFGMGIDKPDVRFVIHHDMPKSLEGYYQETGRAGRDGGEGYCLAFYSYDDIQKLEKFLKGKAVAEQEIGHELISETVMYAETSICRRKVLLKYFGEEFKEQNCGDKCDNCAFPRKRFEGQEYIMDVIDIVSSVNEKFKDMHIVNILTGTINSQIKLYKHDKLEDFGKGAEKSSKFWFSVVRQAFIHGLLAKDVENYGLLWVTEAGKAFLENPFSILITEDKDFEGTDSNEEDDDMLLAGQGSGAADDRLFKMLKDLCKKRAKQLNVPPFVIFQDPSLQDMTIQYPINMEELKNISGVGPGKALKYGEPFIQLIAQYVQDNDIERPVDFVVKSIANRSQLKVSIIQNIDRKIDVEDIAVSKGLEIPDLITEMESIVYSGTKLDLTYYLNQLLDKEEQQEIFNYFKTAENDSIESAIESFGEDTYSEWEIRLMRLKFMSEVAN